MADTQNQLLVSQAALRIAKLLNQTDGIDSAINMMMSEFIDLVRADEGSIQLLRPYSDTTHYTLIRNHDSEKTVLDSRLDDFLVGCVMRNNKALLSHDIVSLIGLQNIPHEYKIIQSVLAVPMLSNGSLSGVINLIRKTNGPGFNQADQEMILELAKQIEPFIENAALQQKLFAEKLRLQKNLEERFSVHGIIGKSPSFKVVYELLEQIIPTDARVVICGESGTGKELIAKCIHYAGARKDHPFVAVDCGALPANLLESELFGYVKGAFTGAVKDRQGLIEEAHNGTLFMDEFTNMNLETQAKLLRVIQEEEIRPIGSNQTKKVNVRILVAATDDLTDKVDSGEIRSDLYYRLNVISVSLPPLRQRVEDIPALSDSFIANFSAKHGKKVQRISPQALQILEHYTWPGNIRELENVIERALVLMHFDETILQPKHLPRELLSPESLSNQTEIPTTGDLAQLIDDYERKILKAALIKHNWKKAAVAKELNTTDPVIRYKMKRLNITRPK